MGQRGKGKYYYFRLKEDFFQSGEIIALESEKEGYRYSNFLLKLYCRSLKQEGRLAVNEFVPYNTKMLSDIAGTSERFVKKALLKFEQLGLIEVLDDGVIYMLDIQNFIGKSSDEADRKRDYRTRIEEEKTTLKENFSKKEEENGNDNGLMKPLNEEKSGQMSDKWSGEIENKDRDRDRAIDDDKETIIHHLNNLLGYSDHTERFLNHFKEEDWPKLVEQIEQSEWLQANINREQVPKPSFISKILNGGYKTYSSQVQAKPGAVNSQTSKYSGEDKDAMARRKFSEFKNKMAETEKGHCL